jgi:lanosterol synthase
MSNEGMMMSGTNGSQVWDTAFAVQAIMEGKLGQEEEFKDTIFDCLKFLDVAQILQNHPKWKEGYRNETKGAWPFSTRDQGYTVSDCTAEGLKSTIQIQNSNLAIEKLIDDERLFDSVDLLLNMQNNDGGYASYELVRGPQWLEYLNPAQVFGNIMVEYCYVECTTSVLLGLSKFKKYYGNYRTKDIDHTIQTAVRYIHKSQKDDGSWYGSWGICFTYASFFAMESLSTVGENYSNSESVKKACEFLVKHQKIDGGDLNLMKDGAKVTRVAKCIVIYSMKILK